VYRAVLAACLLALVEAMPLSAQEAVVRCWTDAFDAPYGPIPSVAGSVPASQTAATSNAVGLAEARPWETVWGVVGLRAFAAGPKIAPNGEEYHPSFTLDLDFNFWVWRTLGLYLFSDIRFWGERPEYNVTNGKDSGLGFSKRQFDLVGGPAWNYAGAWEARLYGYTYNNLNRGEDLIHPSGFNDGFVVENRYYLSKDYANLGQTGFDEARATFLSIGYYITKDLVGNDGQTFEPGLMLRAYLTYDLWDWPVYAYGDATFIAERSLQPKLLLFDVGVAVQPFRDWQLFSAWQNWELRIGVENTADFQVRDVQNLWYGSIRVVF
jgi:hypothetical protein